MPLPILGHALFEGWTNTPLLTALMKAAPILMLLYALRRFLQGAANLSERNMHGKVVMVTGGTSGIGAEVVRELANRGAQIILLTQQSLGDPFFVDYIEDLRTRSNNELITAEQVNLASLHSIRSFATKWIDNAPPRRLDMIILCGNVTLPPGSKLQSTDDGLEVSWAINYMANFHLLSILSPAIRAQPPDRDVRILFGTCVSYLAGQLPSQAMSKAEVPKKAKSTATKRTETISSSRYSASTAYASSKLALMMFAYTFQRQLNAYTRPDGQENNARVIFVDPGYTRTPGMQRYLTRGSLVGLLMYVIMYPFWWFVLKSPNMGAQSFLYAAMEAEYGRGQRAPIIKECREIIMTRNEILEEDAQQALWEHSEITIKEAEKRGAIARAVAKQADDSTSGPTKQTKT